MHLLAAQLASRCCIEVQRAPSSFAPCLFRGAHFSGPSLLSRRGGVALSETGSAGGAMAQRVAFLPAVSISRLHLPLQQRLPSLSSIARICVTCSIAAAPSAASFLYFVFVKFVIRGSLENCAEETRHEGWSPLLRNMCSRSCARFLFFYFSFWELSGR